MTQRVQSVERALSLLETLATCEIPPTIPELAKAAGVNRATTWRLMNTLMYFELAERDESSGRYKVGSGAHRIAAAARSGNIVRRGRPILEYVSARAGGVAFLEVASRGQLIVMDEVRSDRPIDNDFSFLADLEVPLHCGSVGKLHLSTFSDLELDTYLSFDLAPLTKYTVTDPNILRLQINKARATGIAYNYKEHREEWCGISSAIKDRDGHLLAYLNVTMPTKDKSEVELHNLSPMMRNASVEISELLEKSA